MESMKTKQHLRKESKGSWDKYIAAEVEWWQKTFFGSRQMALSAHNDFFQLIYDRYCKFLHGKSFPRALEIGTGASGGFLCVLSNIKQKYSLDIISDELDKIGMLPFKNKINYLNGRAEKMPFDNEDFDLVIISNTLDHCEDMNKVVSEIKRVLKPGAYVLFVTYLNVSQPHPHTFKTDKEARRIWAGMRLMEYHVVINNSRFRKRNNYYVAIFQKYD